MKQLVRKPFFLAMLLSIPLWIVFNNFIVAVMVALFSAFLVSMCHSLYVVNRANKAKPPADSQSPPD
jgi:hypothetical protein